MASATQPGWRRNSRSKTIEAAIELLDGLSPAAADERVFDGRASHGFTDKSFYALLNLDVPQFAARRHQHLRHRISDPACRPTPSKAGSVYADGRPVAARQ